MNRVGNISLHTQARELLMFRFCSMAYGVLFTYRIRVKGFRGIKKNMNYVIFHFIFKSCVLFMVKRILYAIVINIIWNVLGSCPKTTPNPKYYNENPLFIVDTMYILWIWKFQNRIKRF